MKIICNCCGEEIEENSMVLLSENSDVYCNKCFEEVTFTTFFVKGIEVGNETNSALYRDLSGLKEDLAQTRYKKILKIK